MAMRRFSPAMRSSRTRLERMSLSSASRTRLIGDAEGDFGTIQRSPRRRRRSWRPSGLRARKGSMRHCCCSSISAMASASRSSRRSASPKELAELILIDGEGLGAALGERGVAVVEEIGGVAEEERGGKGRRGAGVDDVDAELAMFDAAEGFDERGHVEDVAEAFAIGLQEQRKRRVAGGDREQVVGAFALLPERSAAVGAAARQEQSAAGCLAETAGEEGGRALSWRRTRSMTSADSTRNQSDGGWLSRSRESGGRSRHRPRGFRHPGRRRRGCGRRRPWPRGCGCGCRRG